MALKRTPARAPATFPMRSASLELLPSLHAAPSTRPPPVAPQGCAPGQGAPAKEPRLRFEGPPARRTWGGARARTSGHGVANGRTRAAERSCGRGALSGTNMSECQCGPMMGKSAAGVGCAQTLSAARALAPLDDGGTQWKEGARWERSDTHKDNQSQPRAKRPPRQPPTKGLAALARSHFGCVHRGQIICLARSSADCLMLAPEFARDLKETTEHRTVELVLTADAGRNPPMECIGKHRPNLPGDTTHLSYHPSAEATMLAWRASRVPAPVARRPKDDQCICDAHPATYVRSVRCHAFRIRLHTKSRPVRLQRAAPCTLFDVWE